MKQLVTDFAEGRTWTAEAPVPRPGRGQVLIQSRASLISTGTERMLVEFGRSSLLQKARSQPAKVKLVLAKARTDGFKTTFDAVRSKLSDPLPLGYCNAGIVVEVGEGVSEFRPGDRVASNGPHAEFFAIGRNLCTRIPDAVDDETAAATVAAAIGLQGLRLAEPTLGESAVVIGTGLIGLLTVQLLLAQGCRVLAIDLDDDRLAQARSFGAEIFRAEKGTDPVAKAHDFSRGRGVDMVLICTATTSDLPVAQAAHMARRNGRVILVGVAGLNINRDDFYKKELIFRVSCSYGPGRYDPLYEERGQDYPPGFVRWTEQRNFEAVLDMMAAGKIQVKPLVTARHNFAEAPKAYDTLVKDKKALAIILSYPDAPALLTRQIPLPRQMSSIASGAIKPRIGFLGAGNYAARILIPAFRQAGANLGSIASAGGLKAALVGGRHGFAAATTDSNELLTDADHAAVVIATRHASHASLAAAALAAGKHVFVEKPLALTQDEVVRVETALAGARANGLNPLLMVGYNRRFSPFTQCLKAWADRQSGPKAMIATMNAGAIPADSWIQDGSEGGRIVGEACHLIDLLLHLAGAPIVGFDASAMLGSAAAETLRDTATITLRFANGSVGTVHYFANGAASFAKERIEVFCGGTIAVIDNFRRLEGYGSGAPSLHRMSQDKGQKACVKSFLDAISGDGPVPIPEEEIMEVAHITIAVARHLDAQR